MPWEEPLEPHVLEALNIFAATHNFWPSRFEAPRGATRLCLQRAASAHPSKRELEPRPEQNLVVSSLAIRKLTMDT